MSNDPLAPPAVDRRALVTGGSGYFGSLLIARLLAAGYRCTSLDINPAEDLTQGVAFVQGDIRDPVVVRAAVADADVVFHNVAQVPLAKDRHLFESVNIDGTRCLLDAAFGSRRQKVVCTSSSAVFGVPERNPVTEETLPRPREAYGRSKLEAERIGQAYAARGLDVTIIRPRTILGHGRLGIFQILFEWIREGRNVPVLGRGDNLYQFVHADDLADACIRAGGRPGAAIYNCGTDRFATMRESLEALCRHAGTGARVKSVPMRPAVWAMKLTSAAGLSPLGAYHALMYGRAMYFDIAEAQRELGWQPRFSNAEMLIDSYDWYCGHREAVLSSGGQSHHRSPVAQGVLGLVGRWL